MEEILLAVQKYLQDALAFDLLKKYKSVYITPHENIIPTGVLPPCVGIKDGEISRTELMGGCLECTYHVSIIIYVGLRKDEQKLVGDNLAGKPGVLDLAKEIRRLLDHNFLDDPEIIDAFCNKEEPSEIFGDEENFIQRKILTYRYVRHEEGEQT